jgi:phospholipid/cholesterol/gamma-HCH transport system substrate-binding protein
MFYFGELERFTKPRYHILLQTTNASGLRGGSPVEYNGVPVGVIDRIGIEANPQFPVGAHLLIQEHVRLPRNAEIAVSAPLIGGSAMLKVTAPPHSPGQAVDHYPTDGSAVITAELAGGMLDSLGAQLDERMKPLMESLEKFNTLADEYTKVGANINAMLAEQGEAAIANGEPPNLRTAVTKINTAIDEATEGLRLAKQWLSDEQLNADVKSAVSKANQLIDQATSAVDHYTKLAGSLEKDANDLTRRMLTVADQLEATLENVQSLSAMARNGEGTLGQLLTNPDLYNSLNEAAVRLERTLVEVQLFVQKVKAEGLPMKLF